MASAIDKSTLQKIDSGRAALGDIIASAQSQLQKVFVVFLIGFLGAFYAFRYWALPALKQQLLFRGEKVQLLTPFDYILLQAKISLICGAIVAVVALLYVSRDALRARGLLPKSPISRWKLVALSLVVIGLFIGGVLYSYYLFFPLLFEFLTTVTIQSGIDPHFSLVKWVHFIAILALAMGMAAEMPLIMTLLSYTEIVPYETFRSKWRHAIVVMFVVASVINGSPDPFSMSLVAGPLIVLYVVGLGISKFVVTIKYSSERVGIGQIILSNWISIIGSALVTGLLAYAAVARGMRGLANSYIHQIETQIGYNLPMLPSVEWLFALQGRHRLAMIAFAVTVAFVVGIVALVIQLFRTVDAKATHPDSVPENAGDPSAIDLSRLDAESIAAAPPEAFEAMSEDEALEHASTAMDAGNHQKAQAILDRFDTVQTQTNTDGAPLEAGAAAAAPDSVEGGDMDTPAPRNEATTDADSNVVTETTTGMLNAFTEDERTEDDIGGYFYDIRFIFASLASNMFKIVGLFTVVMGVSFAVLYRGGIKILKKDFLSRLPPEIRTEVVDITALHPVEMLVFAMKLSVVFGAAVTLPLLLYYMWPSMNERDVIRSSHGLLFTWTMCVFLALIAGSVIGYAIVAPYVISWLVTDAIQAGMIVKYQINAAGWLVFFTTVGVGLLATIPVTMFFLHRGGLVPYRVLRGRWREAVSAIIAIIAVASPGGVFSMLLFSLPVVGVYLLGVGFLSIYTVGGRRVGPLKKSRHA